MPDDVKTVALYEQDFFEWGMAQARALRAVRDVIQRVAPQNSMLQDALQALDWDNLAEEIEGLARRDRRELTSRVMTIIEHLVKLQHSPATEPRAGWMETIGHARSEIEDIVRDSPSLHREVAEVITRKAERAAQLAAKSLVAHGQLADGVAERPAVSGTTYSVEQVVGDWRPDAPAAKSKRPAHRQDNKR
jgi:hypothetical protein